MARFSQKLAWMLRVRVAARVVVPLAVLWGIFDWFRIAPLYGLIYALLTFNYVVVFLFVVARSPQVSGPLRIRPFQTFVLIINAVVLPIVFYRTHGLIPWFFIAVSVLMLAGLYAGAVIYLYFLQKLPMASIFQRQYAGPPAA